MTFRTSLYVQGLVIAVLAAAVFLPAASGPFIWDDRFLLAQIQNRDIGQLLSSSFLARPGESVGDFFRPLTTLSLALDYHIWGEQPVFFHLTNLLLHALGALAVWTLARRLIGPSAGFAAACFFAVHPAHCEPVCWISGRADLLYSFFLVLAILAYIRWQGSRLVILSLVPAVLALLAKETAVVLAALAPLCLWLAGERRARELAKPAALFGGVAVAYFGIRYSFLPTASADLPPASLYQHAALVVYSLFMHLQIVLIPHSAQLGYHIITNEIVGWTMLKSAVALAAVSYLAVSNRRHWPVLFFALVWFAASILPASGIIRGATQTVIAQRYVYLSSVGLALLLGLFAAQKGVRWSRMAPAAAVIVYFGVISFSHSGLWADDVVFWQRFVRDTPAMGWARYHLGVAYMERQQEEPARKSFLAAAALMPEEALPLVGVGESYIAEGRPEKAVPHLDRAARLAPHNLFVLERLEAARLGARKSAFSKGAGSE